MAIDVIHHIRIIRGFKLLHGVEGLQFCQCSCAIGINAIVFVFIVVGISFIVVVGLGIIPIIVIIVIVVIIICFFIIIVIVVFVIVSCGSMGLSVDFIVVVIVVFVFLCWRVVAHFVELDDVGGNPSDILHLPDAVCFQVEHLESATGVIFGVSNEHAMGATVGQLAAQWSGIVHGTNLTKNVQVRDE